MSPGYLDAISKDLIGSRSLPPGVTEAVYDTEAEMRAFLDGLNWVGDIDVHNGTPFVRDGSWVVRVGMDGFDDDEMDDEMEEPES